MTSEAQNDEREESDERVGWGETNPTINERRSALVDHGAPGEGWDPDSLEMTSGGRDMTNWVPAGAGRASGGMGAAVPRLLVWR